MDEKSPRIKINPTNTIFLLWTFGEECSSFKEAEQLIAGWHKSTLSQTNTWVKVINKSHTEITQTSISNVGVSKQDGKNKRSIIFKYTYKGDFLITPWIKYWQWLLEVCSLCKKGFLNKRLMQTFVRRNCAETVPVKLCFALSSEWLTEFNNYLFITFPGLANV